MVQSEVALEAYNSYFANAPIPEPGTVLIIVIAVYYLITLWQARVFIHDF
ncbi:MAG: hypothetical protein RBT65_15170 [Methanolobus sp.]|jgi:hypothetical protein|nr:hypothetical protein [Methanolobus sp.]